MQRQFGKFVGFFWQSFPKLVFWDSHFVCLQVLTDTDTSTHKMADKSWRTVSKIRLRPGIEDRNKAVFCLVNNHVSLRPLQAMARLRVRYKPRVLLTVPDDPAVVEGGDMNLVCQVEAYPPVHTFAW